MMPTEHVREHRISAIDITPVAFRDLPLLNTVGVHEPFALRAIIEMTTDSGITGLGETYGDSIHLKRLRGAAHRLIGIDAFDTNAMLREVSAFLASDTMVGGDGVSGMVTGISTTDRVLSPFEVAALDIQGKATGLSVSELLGGAVRTSVPFSGYLFYKWAGHPGQADDEWGAALDPDGIVEQAGRMHADFGFSAFKLKGGVFPPDQEVAAIHALRAAFPGHPLRLDPNAAWSVESSIAVANALDGVLEYLEDPTAGIAGMAAVRREAPMPLATNMCVVSFDHIAPAVAEGAVDIVLSDHHFWGGLRRSQLLAGICTTFSLGLSMHSNSHLSISLAAMVHLAAATPRLDYACDTHWPWKDASEDVIVPGALTFRDGAITAPTKPGLGIELDRDALAHLHEQYLKSEILERDDTSYMQRFDPSFELKRPRW